MCVFKAPGLGPDLTLRLITGTKNIRRPTRTTGNSGAITVASEGPTISGVEDGASSPEDAISVEVAAVIITTTTTGQTGKTTNSIRRNTSSGNSSSRSSLTTIHRDDRTTSRIAQEAPLRVNLTALTDPSPLYPDTRITLPPRLTPLPQKPGKLRGWLVRPRKTLKMGNWPQSKFKREGRKTRSQKSMSSCWKKIQLKVQVVGKVMGTGKAQRKTVWGPVRWVRRAQVLVRPLTLRSQMTQVMAPLCGSHLVAHAPLGNPHVKV